MEIRFKEGCDIKKDFFHLCQVFMLRYGRVWKRLFLFQSPLAILYVISRFEWNVLSILAVGMIIFSCANISKQAKTIFFELGWWLFSNGWTVIKKNVVWYAWYQSMKKVKPVMIRKATNTQASRFIIHVFANVQKILSS